jgi:carboxymethylenebutenolidase
MIQMEATRGPMNVHLARPSAPGPWPGVLVISDALGMTTDLRNQADWLAGEGFLSAAPDLYYWGGRIRCMFATMQQIPKRRGQIFDDFALVRDLLVGDPDCTGRIGVIGFCLGGGFALLLAGDGGYSASSVNYGDVPDDALSYLSDACPIVASYGGKDRTTAEAPDRLTRALETNGVPRDVKVYAEAGHSFLNDHAPGEMPMWALITGKFASSGYHEPSARDARQRIVGFFRDHLEDPEPS